MNFLQKQVVKKKEGFEWDGFMRELTIYQIQLVLFALMQVYRMHFSSLVETISALIAVAVLLLYPVFYLWIIKADVKPPKGKFMTIKEMRGIFQQIKGKYKWYAIFTPVRKFLMCFVLVVFNKYPILQLGSLSLFGLGHLCVLIQLQPFKLKKQNLLQVICELFFTIAHLLLLSLPLFERRLSVVFVKLFGWAISFFFSSAILLELVQTINISRLTKK